MVILNDIFKNCNKAYKIDIAKNFSTMNDKDPQIITTSERITGMKYSIVHIAEKYVEDAKSPLVIFLKQTIDKIIPVAFHLMTKVLTPLGDDKYFKLT